MTKRFWPTTLTALILGWALAATTQAVHQRGGLEIDPNGLVERPCLVEDGHGKAPGLDGGDRPEPAGLSQRGGLEIDPNG